MSWISRFFSMFSARTPPPESMRTVPCTGFDLVALDLILTTGLIINTRLESKKLEETISTLVERKFPRAGARIARRNGVYEFQVPKTFRPDTPPVVFTAADYPEPYQSAARPEIPTHISGSQPSVSPMPDMSVYFRSKTCPASLDAFLVPNTPLLHVHVSVFDDITFLGITASHIAFDALGTGTLLHAWTRLINGDEIDTIPGMDWDAMPFESFTGPTAVTHQRGWFDLGLIAQLLFIVRFVLRLFWDPKETPYLVRVPKGFLDDSKRQIMEDLKSQGSTEWVGSSDVLLAWWFKTVFGYRASDDTTPIHIHVPVNLRAKSVFPSESTLATPYINNAVSGIPVPPVPVNAFRRESLGTLSLHIRRAILAYNADLAGMRADMHWRCANPSKMIFPCPADGEFSIQTNWLSARLSELDFSGACAPGSERKARVVSVLPVSSAGKPIPLRGGGAVLMEDEQAVWMSQVRGEKDWEKIRQSGTIAFI
ncbi:hypothetical protein DFH07DRAFT_928442 [Mycena maculata]|uniref:Uncharacterized protein n=1 Tax=Mycena maculata TaxID=230809 RepID=A0AAD7I428_9AGAR|nr:hypothetical protein DFH07DRAFT_928442 [Mycena maculata]